uniref:ABC transporter permease subunit n=1 Tax=Desulfacinum infernum TaxID=35837 RepID=A0A832EI21_9BACT
MKRRDEGSRSERAARLVLGAAVVTAAALTGAIFLYMVVLAFPLFAHGHVFRVLTQDWAPLQGRYGIRPMIAASLALSFGALALAIPISLGCAAFVTMLGRPKPALFVRRFVQTMTGIPTVVYGFVGVFLVVPAVRDVFQAGSGRCLLSAILVLALMITPTMVLFFIDAMESVPKEYVLAASALGAGPAEKFLWIVLPCARVGLITGVLLAFGRAFGDTLVSLMLAGNAAVFPSNLFHSVRTLTAHIALVIAADFQSLEFASIFACGVVLYTVNAAVALVAWNLRSRVLENHP